MARRRTTQSPSITKTGKLPPELLETMESQFMTERQQGITKTYRKMFGGVKADLKKKGLTSMTEEGQAVYDTMSHLAERHTDMTPGEVAATIPTIKSIQSVLNNLESGRKSGQGGLPVEEYNALNDLAEQMETYAKTISTTRQRVGNLIERNLPDISSVVVGILGRNWASTIVTKYGIDLIREHRQRKKDIAKETYDKLIFSMNKNQQATTIGSGKSDQPFMERYTKGQKAATGQSTAQPKQTAPNVDEQDQSYNQDRDRDQDQPESQSRIRPKQTAPNVDDQEQEQSESEFAEREKASEEKKSPLNSIDRSIKSILRLLEGKKPKKDGEEGDGIIGKITKFFTKDFWVGLFGGAGLKTILKTIMGVVPRAGIWGIIAAELVFIAWGLNKSYDIIVDINKTLATSRKGAEDVAKSFDKMTKEKLPEITKKRKEEIDQSNLSEPEKAKAKEGIESKQNMMERINTFRKSRFSTGVAHKGGEKEEYVQALLNDDQWRKAQKAKGVRDNQLKNVAYIEYDQELAKQREYWKIKDKIKEGPSVEPKTEPPVVEPVQTNPPVMEKSVQNQQKKAEVERENKVSQLPQMVQQVNQSQTNNTINQGFISSIQPYGETSRIDGMISR